ncbi:MAG: hypothetical protein WC966_11320 [Bradymonadales bacterium]
MGKILQTIIVLSAALLLSSCQAPAKDAKKELKEKQSAVSVVQKDNTSKATDYRLKKVDAPVEAELQKELQELYNAFKEAVITYDGEQAVNYLSASSFGYYEHILNLAKIALNSAENPQFKLNELSPGIRLNVAMLIAKLKPEEVLSASPKSLVVLAIQEGWLGYKSISESELGFFKKYKAGKNDYILVDYLPKELVKERQISRIGFIYEGEGEQKSWKLDLVPLLAAIDHAIEDYAKQERIDPSVLIDEAVRNTMLLKNKSMEWKTYAYPSDGFKMNFPNRPQIKENQGVKLFAAQDDKGYEYSLSTFSAKTDDDPEDTLNSLAQLYIREHALEKHKLHSSELQGLFLRRLSYELPSSKGIVLFILSKTKKVFLIQCRAPAGVFDERSCAKFLDSFSPAKDLLDTEIAN